MRRNRAIKREVMPDARYKDVLLAKFINSLMYDGKKSVAEGIVYEALPQAAQHEGKTPVELFHIIIENVAPLVEVRSRRVGGATYQVPIEVSKTRRTALAIRWLIEAARARKGRSMKEKLVAEFRDAANARGAAVTKRENTHRMAEANRAFSHFRIK